MCLRCSSPPPHHLHTAVALISRKVYFHVKMPGNICSNYLILDSRIQNTERWFGQGTQLLHGLEPRSARFQAKQYLSWRQTSRGRRGEKKGRGAERGTKRPELSPGFCHALAVFWVKSKILGLAINSHYGPISTSFCRPPPSKLSIQAIPVYVLFYRLSPLSLSMVLLMQFSQHFCFSIFQISHLLRSSSSASDWVCPPPAHRSTKTSNFRSISMEDMSRHHINFLLSYVSLVACRGALESSSLLSGCNSVSRCLLTLMEDKHD